MNETIEYIPLGNITPNPDNRRVGGFDQAKLEQLAESIRAVGVQQPAVVRKKDENGSYELVAGERRWRAAKLAGLEALPCVVRDLDDVAVLKISTIENLQREDVHPLDEADGYARLLDRAGYDVEGLAKEVGRSVSYVYQRLKLRDLVESARQALIEGKITSGHAVLIARLQEKAQKEALEYALRGFTWSKEPCTVKELSSWIERTFYLDLQKTAFKKDDETLLPRAGACIDCPKRTGFAPALFPEIEKHDYCLEAGCFKKKCDAILARQRESLKGEDFLEVATEWSNTKGALSPYDWEECKKKDEGAKRALVVNGIQSGRLTWGRKVDRSRPRNRDEDSEDSEESRNWREQQETEEAEIKERTALIEGVVEQLVKCYETKEPGTRFDHGLIFLVVRLLFDTGDPRLDTLSKWGIAEDPDGDYDTEDVLARLKKLPPPQLEMLTVKLLLQESTPGYYGRVGEDFYALAESFGIDVEALREMDQEDEEDEEGEEVEARKCRVCGCTDDDCRQCIEKTGEPCHWVEDDLCSACAEEKTG